MLEIREPVDVVAYLLTFLLLGVVLALTKRFAPLYFYDFLALFVPRKPHWPRGPEDEDSKN